MRYFHKQQNHFWKPVINLDKVHITQLFPILLSLADSKTTNGRYGYDFLNGVSLP